MRFEIERENLSLLIEASVTTEDVGIGRYECHGMRGYDSREISYVEHGDIQSIEVESSIDNRNLMIDFEKLSDRNQEMIIEEINKEL